MAGEVNGLVLCYKSAPLPADPNPLLNVVPPTSSLVNQNKPLPPLPSYPSSGPTSPAPYTKNSNANNPIKSPVRPAPLPPSMKDKPLDYNSESNRIIVISTATLSGFTGENSCHQIRFCQIIKHIIFCFVQD